MNRVYARHIGEFGNDAPKCLEEDTLLSGEGARLESIELISFLVSLEGELSESNQESIVDRVMQTGSRQLTVKDLRDIIGE